MNPGLPEACAVAVGLAAVYTEGRLRWHRRSDERREKERRESQSDSSG